MKIDTNKIPLEGLSLREKINASELDLETEIVKFTSPVVIEAEASKITNAVSVSLNLAAAMQTKCSRCLGDFEVILKKGLLLNYPISKSEPSIDLNGDIREEIILDYSIKPLCSKDCKGLCPKCGKNLNQGGCSCATT